MMLAAGTPRIDNAGMRALERVEGLLDDLATLVRRSVVHDVGDDDFNFTQGPNPNFVIGRPFFNTQTGLEDVQLISVLNELEGTVHVNVSDEFRGDD